jgi:hypothetical protein
MRTSRREAAGTRPKAVTLRSGDALSYGAHRSVANRYARSAVVAGWCFCRFASPAAAVPPASRTGVRYSRSAETPNGSEVMDTHHVPTVA